MRFAMLVTAVMVAAASSANPNRHPRNIGAQADPTLPVEAPDRSTMDTELYYPFTRSAPDGVTEDDIYAAAVRVLNAEGYVLESAIRDAGTVATEWIKVHDDPTVWHRWRVVITNRSVELHIDCRMISVDGKVNCGDAEDRAKVLVDKGNGLLGAIVGEAEGIQQRRAGVPDAGMAEFIAIDAGAAP